MDLALPHPSTFLSPAPHAHPTEISAIRACTNEKALDLVAVGGETWVEVLQRDATQPYPSFKVLATFLIGSKVTSIAWSPRTASPASAPGAWFLELVVTGADGTLRLLAESATAGAEVYPFGGGLSGHRGRINDICFCNSYRYIATAGDDKLCIVWDLDPPGTGNHGKEPPPTASRSPSPLSSESDEQRSDPVAYPITFSHPLHTVSSHSANARSIMVSDSRGTVSVINWTELVQDQSTADGWRGHRVVELVDPRALADGLTGLSNTWGGGASWKQDDENVFGATYGSRWVAWNLRQLQGGKPFMSGEGHLEGGHRFRWCPTNPHLFAISTSSPLPGALIKVYHTSFPHAPRAYRILPRPHRVRDFDWLGESIDADPRNRVWMAVAVGKKVFFLAGGEAQE
ncbi:hypothetical protein BOTBODRAFT_34611 [Botryobasidium botryosum FD-172 SS1]|uniref:Uncharacterized protein n=1 Tax=Botryobasidium botryosum (strain FD-172 SS1) TaxID=930990 RepID=A0A067M9W8_BOTB1|nr:hypothetical protein BOTBODRAFT_34611 [Botryobasidium botryosum FD-172 SS1]